jgi:hypothetical protein
MGFLQSYLWGVHVWIWIYLLGSFFAMIGFVLWLNRKKIHEKFIKWRHPESVIKVVMHYKGGLYKIIWRLIPDDKSFELEKKRYYFKEQNLIKENEMMVKNDKDGQFITIDKKNYRITGLPIRAKGRSYPEIHYKFNNPNPIDYDVTNDKIVFTAVDMKDFKDNDLFKKLLTLNDEKSMVLILMIICSVNLLVSIFIVATLKGWIK